MIDGPKVRIQRLLETGCLPYIAPLALDKHPVVYVPALRIMGNFSSSN